MKDSINKILKKLSIIDYFLITLLLVVTSIAILYFSREKSVVYIYTLNEYSDWQEVPFPSLYWISNSIRAGDIVFDSTGSKIAELISIDNTEWGGIRRSLRLKLKVYALRDRRTGQYRVGDQVLQIGNFITFDIGNTKYEGVISYIGTDLEPPDFLYKYIELQIKAHMVPPWLAKTYDNTFIVKNTEKEVIFRILDSTTVPGEKSVETESGNIVRSKDPFFKDVYINAIGRVRCQEDSCYFNESIPVKIGSDFSVQSSTSILGDLSDVQSSVKITGIKNLEDVK